MENVGEVLGAVDAHMLRLKGQDARNTDVFQPRRSARVVCNPSKNMETKSADVDHVSGTSDSYSSKPTVTLSGAGVKDGNQTSHESASTKKDGLSSSSLNKERISQVAGSTRTDYPTAYTGYPSPQSLHIKGQGNNNNTNTIVGNDVVTDELLSVGNNTATIFGELTQSVLTMNPSSDGYNDVEESLWSKRDTVVTLEDTNIANHSEPNVGRPMNIKPTGSFPSMFINDPKSLFGLGGITPTSRNSVDQNPDLNSDSPIVKSMDINMQPTSYAKAAGVSTSEQPTNKVVTAPVVNNTNNANTSNDGFQQVVNNKCNNKKSAMGNKIPKGVPVAKVFQVGKDFNYQPKALSTVSNGGGTHDETSYKVGSSSYSNEGNSVVKKVTSNDRQKDKDVVDTGVMKISNISSPNPFSSLGDEKDEDDDIENVYDESANLNLNHTLGTSTLANIVPVV
ncbi:hypothetical protein Tco_0070980 [Tanacetum coccineum]